PPSGSGMAARSRRSPQTVTVPVPEPLHAVERLLWTPRAGVWPLWTLGQDAPVRTRAHPTERVPSIALRVVPRPRLHRAPTRAAHRAATGATGATSAVRRSPLWDPPASYVPRCLRTRSLSLVR